MKKGIELYDYDVNAYLDQSEEEPVKESPPPRRRFTRQVEPPPVEPPKKSRQEKLKHRIKATFIKITEREDKNEKERDG